MIGHGLLDGGDSAPAGVVGQSSIQLNEMGLIWRDIGVADDGADRAFGNADGAVYAFVRVDDEEVRAFHEAVHGADCNAVGVLALNTGFGDDIRHGGSGIREVKPSIA